MRWVALVALGAIMMVACGGKKVLTKEEMAAQSRERARLEAEADAKRLAEEEAQLAKWHNGVVNLEQEFELEGTQRVLLRHHDLFIQLVRTGWTKVQTPKGEARNGWVRLLLSNADGSKMKEVNIAEEDDTAAMGFRIEARYAYEKWDTETSSYIPHTKLVVRRLEGATAPAP